MKKFPFTLSVITLTALALASCGAKSSHTHSQSLLELQKCDSIPAEIKSLATAIANNDSTRFASLVSYPLVRPYPLSDIADAAQMRARYAVIVDDSLKSLIVNSTPANWHEFGWRGWTLGDGDYLWIDEKVYEISYLSAREKTERDSLIAADLATLPPDLRAGWTPEMCLASTGDDSVYRIDSRRLTDGRRSFRLLCYAPGALLTGRPSASYEGFSETEGSAAVLTYYFKNKNGDEAIYGADIMDNSTPELVFTTPDGAENAVAVHPAMWLEKVSAASRVTATSQTQAGRR